MAKFYDIERIVGHKKMSNGLILYNVKWKGYDSSNNTWEPQESFVSPIILQQYHDELKKKGERIDEHEMEHVDRGQNKEPPRGDSAPRRRDSAPKRNYLLSSDLLPEDYINKNNYEPTKVLNIYHLQDDKKCLVALLQFKNRNNGFVRAEWANKRCPDLMIKFYENRIFWRQKITGEEVKVTYIENDA